MIGLFLGAYAYFQEAAVTATLSNIYPMLQSDGVTLPNSTQQKLDKVVLSLSNSWIFLEVVCAALTILSVAALVLDLLRVRQKKLSEQNATVIDRRYS